MYDLADKCQIMVNKAKTRFYIRVIPKVQLGLKYKQDEINIYCTMVGLKLIRDTLNGVGGDDYGILWVDTKVNPSRKKKVLGQEVQSYSAKVEFKVTQNKKELSSSRAYKIITDVIATSGTYYDVG